MYDFTEDIPVFMDVFGELVTFTGPGSQFDCRGVFSAVEDAVAPLDGAKARLQYTLCCAAIDVEAVTPRYTVTVRNKEYRVLASTFNPVLATTEILLGHP